MSFMLLPLQGVSCELHSPRALPWAGSLLAFQVVYTSLRNLNYLIDISKYVMTGVVIASLFKDLDENKPLIYIVGLFIAFMALGVGLVLTEKKKGN